MASTRQVKAARRNVRRAQVAARRKRTIAKLPASVRMGKWDLIKALRRAG